jgi:diguanylate cyclase (GGDEF)-like protein
MNTEISLDVRTLLFGATISMPVISWVLWSMRQSIGWSVKGVGEFAVANILLTLGTILLGLRDAIPFELSYIAGNTLVMSAPIQHLVAIRRFDDAPAPRSYALCAMGIAFVLVSFTLTFDDLGARTATVTGWIAVVCCVAAYNLFKNVHDVSKQRSAMIGCFLGLTVANALRAYESLTVTKAISGLFSSSAGSIGLYLIGSVLCLALSIAFILMVTDRVQERLMFLSTHDTLTGARSRGSFMDLANIELLRTERRGTTAAILMADLDHFKRINDAFGHQAGDKALQIFSDCVRASLRKNDIFGRYGGEEFIVFLPDTNHENAMKVAERIRKSIHDHPLPTPGGKHQVTVSLGVASTQSCGLNIEKLIAAADKAAYESKQKGRNRVTSAPFSTSVSATLA